MAILAIIFSNRAPIIWYCKRQNTVEENTFSSEFVAAKAYVEHITTLRFKLRIFGIPAVDYTKILCDNEIVVKNSFIFSSTLNKNHIAIAYHFVKWHVASGAIRVAFIDINANLADNITKLFTAEKWGIYLDT